MDFRFSPQLEAFRTQIQSFLAELLTPEFRTAEIEENGWSPAFSRRLGEKGYIALAWPPEYGGKGGSYFEQLVYSEELARVDAPTRLHYMASSLVGPSVLLFGNEEQKAGVLPRIARGELSFCQGFSEPNAGSDLASLQLRARRDGDSYVINGQKIWTSDAHRADYCWLGARTDPDAPKHKGISTFILDMRSEGLTVRPLTTLNGHHHFNEVFFDNVRIPARDLVGTENRGWYQMTTTLDFERSGASRYVTLARMIRSLVDWVRFDQRTYPPSVIHELAEVTIACEVGRLIGYGVAWRQSKGEIPNAEASMSKAFGSSLEQQVACLGMKIGQLRGALFDLDHPEQSEIADRYMWAAAATIRGGTNEVQKNVIATRGLGLGKG